MEITYLYALSEGLIVTSSYATEQYIMRPPTFDDLPAVVELINICAIEQLGSPEFSIDSLNFEWTEPGVNIATDRRTYWTSDGQLAAYGEFWDTGTAHVQVAVWGRVHPAHRGRGLGSAIIEWAHRRADASLALAPAGAQVVLSTHIFNTATDAATLLKQHGFELVRHFWRMVRELDSPPEPAQMPAGVSIRPYNPETEFSALVETYAATFNDHWGRVNEPLEQHLEQWEHTRNGYDYDASLWFVALHAERVIGIAVCWPKIDDDPAMGWVGTLGVRREWRRQKIGLALLNHALGEFYRRGKKRAGLGVDAASLTGATKLYEQAGMHKTRQYDFYEKVLRAGIDLRTQSVD